MALCKMLGTNDYEYYDQISIMRHNVYHPNSDCHPKDSFIDYAEAFHNVRHKELFELTGKLGNLLK